MSRRLLKTTVLSLFAALVMVSACSGPEQRKAAYVKRGEEYLAAGNLDKARVEFSNALQIDPNYAQARYLAGRVAEKEVKPRDAAGNYQAAIDSDPNHVNARAALGRVFLLAGLPDKAEEIIAPGLKLAPEDPGLLVVRGGLRALKGDAAGAMADAEAAAKSAPDDELTVAFLASIYRQASRVDDAIKAVAGGLKRNPDSTNLRVILADLNYGVGRMDEVEKVLGELAKLRPSDLSNWQRLAQFYLVQKKPEKAEASLREAIKANPDNVDVKNALVGFLASHRGVDQARRQILDFVKAEPKSGELKLVLGQFYVASGDAESAAKTYREVVAAGKGGPTGLVASTKLAELLIGKGDTTGADALITEVLVASPRDNDALILRASRALARNETSAAITDLRAVLRDQPTSLPVMRALARAHVQDGDLALAEEVLRSAVEASPADLASRLDLSELLIQTNRIAEANPVLEQLVRDSPGDLRAREALFRLQIAQANLTAAATTAEAVRSMQPGSSLGYILAAAVLEKQGRTADAMTTYEAALKLPGDVVPVVNSLVRLDLLQKQPMRALTRLSQQIEQHPDDYRLYIARGELRASRGDHVAAEADFNQAIAKAPSQWPSYRAKAYAMLLAKQPDKAIAALQTGIASTHASPALAIDLAEIHLQAKRVNEAIAVYEDALKKNASSSLLANNLAMVLVTHRNDKVGLDRAEQLANQISMATDAAYLDTRGWVKFRRGEFVEALPLLKQAVDKAPKVPALHYHLGMAQLQAGDKAAAKKSLETALAANVKFSGVEEARAALDTLGEKG